MSGGNRFQSELAATASTLLLIIIKRKKQIGYIYLCSNRPQESSVHKPMRWTLMSFLAPCWTSVPPPSSPLWVWRRNRTNSPKYSLCDQTHFHHPLFLLQSAFLCHIPLLAPSSTTNSSLCPFWSHLLSHPPVLPELSPWLTTPPKHHRRANITATTPFFLFQGPPQTLRALSTHPFCHRLQRTAQAGGECARGGIVQLIQP